MFMQGSQHLEHPRIIDTQRMFRFGSQVPKGCVNCRYNISVIKKIICPFFCQSYVVKINSKGQLYISPIDKSSLLFKNGSIRKGSYFI